MNNFNLLEVVERFRRKIKLYENLGEIKVVTKDSGNLGHISKTNFNHKPLKIDVIQNANNKYIAFVDDENKVKIGFNTQLQYERNFVQISDQRYKNIAFHPYNKSQIACLKEDSCGIHVYEISEILGTMKFQLKKTTNFFKGITIFRWNQVNSDLMLIVNDINTITLWGSSQKYFDPITTDAPIINADWCFNGQLFFVSYGQTIKLFNHNIREEFVLSEKRNQYFIILEKDEKSKVSYSLSLGTLKDTTKYCMYELNHETHIATNYERTEIQHFSIEDQGYYFYDEKNGMLYIGKQFKKEIYCFDYDRSKKSLQLSYIINCSFGLYNIFMSPVDSLSRIKNEIALFYGMDLNGNLKTISIREETLQALEIEKTFESIIGETDVTPQLKPIFLAKALAKNKIRTTPQLIEIEEPAQIEKLNQLCEELGVSKFAKDCDSKFED